MIGITSYPLLVFVISFVVLAISARLGVLVSQRRHILEGDVREDFGVIQAATLTLLGLIIGFTFSMALNRYDQRKNYEEEEANAIGTEYARAGLLPLADAAKVRPLLVAYLDRRIAFYEATIFDDLSTIEAQTAKLQADLWSAVQVPAAAQPTPIVALAVAGMNDVLNSQGYTQAAWWNRIPVAAWGLMAMIAVFANGLVGFGARDAQRESRLLLILPLVVAIAFFLIADIESPRGGMIRVHPQNLISLASALRTQ
ncbi:MAG: hypothetical protein ACTHLX_22255 [Candidatus Binatia bacterium]